MCSNWRRCDQKRREGKLAIALLDEFVAMETKEKSRL